MTSGVYIRTQWHKDRLNMKGLFANHGMNKGKKFTDKHKEKLRQAKLGKKLSEEHKRKISDANKGRIRTEEAKKKISLSKRGIKKTPEQMKNHKTQFVKGMIPPMKGRHHTEEAKLNMSKAQTGLHSKEKHHMWKGGITPINKSIRASVDMRLRRKSIFIKDNFTCKKCKDSGGYIEAHHINNFADFPELRLDINNGIVLCRNCHFRFHSIYGKKNNTYEQLKSFIINYK